MNNNIGCATCSRNCCKNIRLVDLRQETFDNTAGGSAINKSPQARSCYKCVFIDVAGLGFTINTIAIQAYGAKPYCTDDPNIRFNMRFLLTIPAGGKVVMEQYLLDDKENA